MITPQTLHVENWAQWKIADLKLNHKGLTFLRGKNLDNIGNSNFVGKSTLINSMSAMLYGDHQLSVKKNSLKSLVSAQTHISLILQANDHEVVADMHANKLKVSIDGADIEARKGVTERVELLKLIGMSDEMFYSTVHINGIASNPLIRGRSAMRCQFLEKAFDLDRWSNLHTKVGDVISQMRRADEELERVKNELESLGEEIDVAKVEVKHNKLLAKQKQIGAFLAAAHLTLGRLKDLPKRPDLSVTELRSYITELEEKVKKAHIFALKFAEWEKITDERIAIKKKLNQLVIHDVHVPSVAIEEKIRKIEAFLARNEVNVEEAIYIKRWQVLAVITAKEHNIPWQNLEQLHALSLGWVKNWSDGQTECPICGSKLKRKVDGERLRKMQKFLNLITKVYDVSIIPTINQQHKSLLQLKSRLATILENEVIENKARELRKHLKELPQLKRPTNVENVDKLELQLSEYREQLMAAIQWERAGKYADIEISGLKQKIEKANQLDLQVSKYLASLESQLHQAEIRKESFEKLDKRREQLEHEVSLRPAYKALQQAYSPNGMRLWLLQELLEALVSGLNEHKFSRDQPIYGYKLSRNRELALTASNICGTYDIRYLSGAESSLFVLNFLLVLLPMIPSNRRCNLLVLDDIDSACSKRSCDIIATDYLPRLKRIVDSVLVITPNVLQDFHVSGSRELLVIKKGGVSSLSGG